MGARVSRSLGSRQDRALNPRRELHGVVQLEDLREGRRRHLGNAADGLSAHPAGHAEPRAARLRSRRLVFVVSVQRESREVSPGARPAGADVARGAQEPRSGGGVGIDRGRPGQVALVQVGARHGRIRALALGRGRGDRRGRERLHDPQVRPRSHRRLLPDSGDVDGVVRRRQPLPVAHRRRLHELLRLVLRPAAVESANLGRADRRPGIGRLVQLDLHHGVGVERAPDAHARCPFLHRGPIQGREDRRRHSGLFGSRQARGPVAASYSRHGRGARDGDGPRDPEGVPSRAAVRVLPGLLPPL